MDGDRADARGGRRLLLDRAERDRACARRLRACRPRSRHDRGRAGVRPCAGEIPLWAERLGGNPRFEQALEDLRPYVAGARGTRTPEFAELWQEMTSVRRSAPG